MWSIITCFISNCFWIRAIPGVQLSSELTLKELLASFIEQKHWNNRNGEKWNGYRYHSNIVFRTWLSCYSTVDQNKRHFHKENCVTLGTQASCSCKELLPIPTAAVFKTSKLLTACCLNKILFSLENSASNCQIGLTWKGWGEAKRKYLSNIKTSCVRSFVFLLLPCLLNKILTFPSTKAAWIRN